MRLIRVLVSAAVLFIVTVFTMSIFLSKGTIDEPSFIRGAERPEDIKVGSISDAGKGADFTTTPSGLQYKIIKQGQGAPPTEGQKVKAHYTGWLNDFDSDKKFDSSRDRKGSFAFTVGVGQVIAGWDETFVAMLVGERRRIIVPPKLGYGARGARGLIPGGATLYFDVELLNIG
jgi:FKBP-type peptidyl-prolyl cis-trans isomerase